jgi:hypothetical protein
MQEIGCRSHVLLTSMHKAHFRTPLRKNFTMRRHMMLEKNVDGASYVDEQGVVISSQKARQGRTGKHTLNILIVSMVIAAVAGIALGWIPLSP